jgi:hypothetical protein
MNDDEFKRRLSEVAEWEMPKLTPTDVREAQKSARGKHKRTEEELYQLEHEQTFLEIFQGINPTLKPILTKVIHQPNLCECGKVCDDGCPKDLKLHHSNGKSHWRKKCLSCNMTQNPYTGEFDLSPQRASGIWATFLRESKGAYKSKGNIAKQTAAMVTKNETQTVISNDQETITFYHDNCKEK